MPDTNTELNTEPTEIELRAIELLTHLTENVDFTIPDIDWNDDAFQIPQSLIDALATPPEKLTPGALTERIVDGKGMFDQLMTACKAHLKDEYESNRIIGAEYIVGVQLHDLPVGPCPLALSEVEAAGCQAFQPLEGPEEDALQFGAQLFR